MVQIIYKNTKYDDKYIVANSEACPILELKTSSSLNLIQKVLSISDFIT